MSFRIPLPDVSKFGDFSDVIKNMRDLALRKQEAENIDKYRAGSLQQQAQELAQKKAYEQALLGLKQKEEERAAMKAANEQYLAQQLFGTSPQPTKSTVTPFDQKYGSNATGRFLCFRKN